MAHDGNTEVFTVDLRTRRQARLTNHPAIDTSPSFSPDSREITFNSDRGGSPQIYVMNRDGSNVRRISRGQGYYYTPVWSPRGDLIAFTRQHAGEFYIGVMRDRKSVVSGTSMSVRVDPGCRRLITKKNTNKTTT